MSNWWNKLNRDRGNDPSFRQHMDDVVQGSSMLPAAAKRGVLALKIVDPCNFKEMIATQMYVRRRDHLVVKTIVVGSE